MNILKEVMEMPEIRFKRLEYEMGILNKDIFGAGSMTEEQLMFEIDWLESRPKLSTKEEFEKLKNAYPEIAEAFTWLFAMALRATPKSPAQRRMQEMIRKDSWVQSQLASMKKPENGGISAVENRRSHVKNGWKITRGRKSFAYAERTNLKEDTILSLAVKLKLNVREAVKGWLRGENGECLTEEDIKTRYKFRIPNTVLLILPALPDLNKNFWGRESYYPGYIKIMNVYNIAAFRERLEAVANAYRNKKFKIQEYDFNLSSTETLFTGKWPVYGFIVGGHGREGNIEVNEKVSLTPDLFSPWPDYKYGLVRAVACFAGSRDWHAKAAAGADVYVSPNFVTIGIVPKGNPPKD